MLSLCVFHLIHASRIHTEWERESWNQTTIVCICYTYIHRRFTADTHIHPTILWQNRCKSKITVVSFIQIYQPILLLFVHKTYPHPHIHTQTNAKHQTVSFPFDFVVVIIFHFRCVFVYVYVCLSIAYRQSIAHISISFNS